MPSISAVTGCCGCLRITVSVPSGSMTPVFHIGHGYNVLFAEVLYHLVGRQPHLPQLVNIELTPADDDGRLTVQQPPESAAFGVRRS